MTTLKELLAEYAEQARPYQVREEALRRGRRLRRLRVAVPAGAAALTLVVTGLTVVTLGNRAVVPTPPQVSPSLPLVTPTLPADRVSLPGYPAEVVSDPDAPPLPSDEPVGPGLLVYTNLAGPWFGLVTRSGAQYRLDPLGGGSVLSPAGRWLLSHRQADPSSWKLRDLTGTSVTTLPGPGTPRLVWLWSVDDHWLLLGGYSGEPFPPETATFFGLSQTPPTQQEIDLRPWPGFAPAAIRTDGTIVLWPAGPGAGDRLGEVVLVDPDTGGGRPVRIDLSTMATPDELAYMTSFLGGTGAPPVPIYTLPDGSALLQLWQPFGDPGREGYVPTDVLVLDLDAGVVRERWDLPEPRPIVSDLPDQWETWSVRAVLPEGILLTHRNTRYPLAWELLDPATGTLHLVTDLQGLPKDY